MPAPALDWTMPAVQTSYTLRNRLKSSTSAPTLPSRIRTLTAFGRGARLVTVSSEANALLEVERTV